VSSCTEAIDVEGYEAMVIGSSVDGRQWLAEAEAFLRQHARTFLTRPVWMFSVRAQSTRHVPTLVRQDPKAIRELEELIHARGARFFTEETEQDWLPVESWAARIGDELREDTSKPPPVASGHPAGG
jgi:hypothetical protein